jgi:hypothetical protein
MGGMAKVTPIQISLKLSQIDSKFRLSHEAKLGAVDGNYLNVVISPVSGSISMQLMNT